MILLAGLQLVPQRQRHEVPPHIIKENRPENPENQKNRSQQMLLLNFRKFGLTNY